MTVARQGIAPRCHSPGQCDEEITAAVMSGVAPIGHTSSSDIEVCALNNPIGLAEKRRLGRGSWVAIVQQLLIVRLVMRPMGLLHAFTMFK